MTLKTEKNAFAKRVWTMAVLALGVAGAAMLPAGAQVGPRAQGFSVDFSQCTEFAGVGPVDLAKASSLVQPAFTTLPVGSTAAIVVRATRCASAHINANGGPGIPTTISQIGIEIVPPDGTGDINNYTLIYVTDNAQLALAFRLVGLPALFDPTITYEFTYDSTGKSGELYVAAEGA